MTAKMKMAAIAVVLLTTASPALANENGIPEQRFPAEAAANAAPVTVYEGRNAAIFEGRNAATQRPVKPFTAEEKALFDRANGSLDH